MCCLIACQYLIYCVNDHLCLLEVVCSLIITWSSLFHIMLFSMTLADATSSLFSVRAIDDMCRDKVDDDVIRNVERIIELVMIRDNMLQLSE